MYFMNMADASYSFKIVPEIKIAVLYWEVGEDFLPEAKILYDRTINNQLPLDVIFLLAVEVCARIGKSL